MAEPARGEITAIFTKLRNQPANKVTTVDRV